MTDILTLPSNPTRIHPLHKKLQLIMCLLSGDCWKTKEFEKLLQTSLGILGEQEQKSNIAHTLPDVYPKSVPISALLKAGQRVKTKQNLVSFQLKKFDVYKMKWLEDGIINLIPR
eukprot:gene2066-2343_t